MTLLHRPYGVEHPYATSADQRTPVRPEAGERVRLGVIVDGPTVGPVRCEWQDPAGAVDVLGLAPAGPSADAAALAGGEGHLAEAQAAQLEADGGWAVTTGPLAAGGHRYRFLAGDEATDWFDVAVATWQPDGGRLTVGGRAEHPRLVPGSVRWLRDEDGVHRCRFALHLGAGQARGGSGERFDALDQRGRTPDAVVFEQYKAQGERGRTYLPMPFAHVVGGDGWGFHIHTTRRTWYDVGAASRTCWWSRPHSVAPITGSSTSRSTGGPSERALGVPRRGRSSRGAARLGAAAVGLGQRVEHPGARHAAHGHPPRPGHPGRCRGGRGLERRAHDHRVPGRAVAGPPGRLAAPRDRLLLPPDGAWPDPAGWVADMHARGIKVVLWQIPLLKTDETIALDDTDWRPTRPSRCSPTVPRWCATAMWCARRTAPPTATVAGGSRARSCRTCPRPRAGPPGPSTAATWCPTSTSTASRPTAASTPGATTCATPTAAAATRPTTSTRCTSRGRSATCCARAARRR